METNAIILFVLHAQKDAEKLIIGVHIVDKVVHAKQKKFQE